MQVSVLLQDFLSFSKLLLPLTRASSEECLFNPSDQTKRVFQTKQMVFLCLRDQSDSSKRWNFHAGPSGLIHFNMDGHHTLTCVFCFHCLDKVPFQTINTLAYPQYLILSSRVNKSLND